MEKCFKCNYEAENNSKKFGAVLCSVCSKFAPENQEEFQKYISEKISSSALDSFRKSSAQPGQKQKQGMIKKASSGLSMSRPAFGYKYEHSNLVPAENYREVEEIFEEFLNTEQSLRQLSKKRSFSVNGLKKILRNFTYLGKIKFNGQIHQGNHTPIVSSTLFNHVQNKLEKLGIKRN